MDSPKIFALGHTEFILHKNQYYIVRLAFKINFKAKKWLSKHSWKISATKMYLPFDQFLYSAPYLEKWCTHWKVF